MQFPRKTSVGLLVTGIALLSSSCGKMTADADPRQRSPLVSLAVVEPQADSERAFTGTVTARVQSNLGFRVGGKIQQRFVDVGQRVKKGMPLMSMDPVDLKLTAEAQAAGVEAARAKHIQAVADEVRLARLVKADVISPRDYDVAKAALDSTKAQLDATVAQARVSAHASEYAILVADANGVIVSTLVEPAQVVQAGQPVVQLAQDGPREATVNLPEGVRPEIGSAATANLYGKSNRFPARLRQLSEAADPQTRTFEARYVLEGDAADAPIGSTVTITSRSVRAVVGNDVSVPIGAIFDSGRGPGVWVWDSRASSVVFRAVQIGRLSQATAILTRGLEVGEQVVALGAHLLHEGEPVRVASQKQLARE